MTQRRRCNESDYFAEDPKRTNEGERMSYIKEIHDLQSQLQAAKERVEKLENALKFYADGREWSSMGLGAYADIGKIAREALKGAT